MIYRMACMAVISHDAGGAEALSAYLLKKKPRCVVYYLEGPAVKIFQERKLIQPGYKLTIDWDPRITEVLASMSWKSHLFKSMICEAKARGIRSNIILDSWYNYERRFGFPEKHWQERLPDRLIVCDIIAWKIARESHLGNYCEIKEVPNFHFEALKKEYQILHKGVFPGSILFLSSPIQTVKRQGLSELRDIRTTEEVLLKDLIRACINKKVSITIRPHPSEKKRKFRNLCCQRIRGVDIQLSRSNSLLKDLAQHGIVVGFCSTALVLAALLKKTVISYAKNDLRNVFGWEQFGVYRHYGIKQCRNYRQLKCAVQRGLDS